MSESTDKTRNAKRIVWICVGGIVVALGTFAFIAFQLSTASKIENQEKFDPCVSLSEAVANHNADRVPALTKGCKEFLNGIGPLVTIKLSCAIIKKARYVCPAPGAEPDHSAHHAGIPLGPTLGAASESHFGPGSSNGGSEGGRAGHDKGTSGGTHGGTKPPPKSHKPQHEAKSEPAPVDIGTGTTPAEAAPQPGNSGETPAAEHSQGVKACVDLVVSACVKTELP